MEGEEDNHINSRKMRCLNLLLINIILLSIVVGCSLKAGVNEGVSDFGKANSDEILNKTFDSDVSDLTDEQITTYFTECLRNEGLNIPDPEVFSDGTINFNALKQNILQDSQYQKTQKGENSALNECLPILESATFSKAPEKEDIINKQDLLLEFTECIRDSGINVSDPDFSNGNAWAEIKSTISEIERRSKSSARHIQNCRTTIFGGVDKK